MFEKGKLFGTWGKKYVLVHWVVLIASVALFLRIATFAEWSVTVCAFGGWYLKVNLDQKKIAGPNA
jgi:hypothetical protein